jgi:hypothetical protein
MTIENVALVDRALARKLIEAESIEETEAAIAAVEMRIANPRWRAVGDIENNHGAAQIGVDPPTQLIERFINGQEAAIELEVRRTGIVPKTPHDAARKLFGVPSRGLADMKDPEVRALAERTVSVTLADSGDKKPTVVVEDRGIGQHPSAMPRTMLALHRSEKTDKPYLIGQYGQGGASTLLHSVYTIFVSRRAPDLLDPGQDDLVGFTVVRFRERRVKGGTYEYLTSDRMMLALTAADAPAPFNAQHGTRVIHVAYDLHGYAAGYRRHKTGLWALVNAAIFDPVLPIHIKGKRLVDVKHDKNASTTGRIAKGNVAVLAGLPQKPPTGTAAAPTDDDGGGDDGDDGDAVRRRGKTWLRYEDEQTYTIEDSTTSFGDVRFRIWVLGGVDSTETYVRADQAISITLCGQRHGQESRDFLRRCKLGFLSKRIIIQIDADGLNREAKRRLFPSGRERQRNTDITELIFKELAEYLANNEDIQALEEEARQEALANASSKVKDSVCKRVARLMQRHLAGTGGNGAGAAIGGGVVLTDAAAGRIGRTPGLRQKPKPPAPKTPPDDSPMPAIPTKMTVANSTLTVQAGRQTHAVLKLDAKNGYLADHVSELSVEIVPAGDVGTEGLAIYGTLPGPALPLPPGPGTKKGGKGGGGGGGGGGGRPHRPIYVKGVGSLMGGRARIVLGCNPNAALGEYMVHVSFSPPGSSDTLVAVATIEVVPEASVPGGQDLAEGGLPEIVWYRHPDDAANLEEKEKLKNAWPDGWTKRAVGDVDESGATVIFRLNESLPELKSAIDRRSTGMRASEAAVTTLKERYAAPVTYGMWLLNRAKERDPKSMPDDWFATSCEALAKAQLATLLDLEIDAEADADHANAARAAS